MFKLNWKTWLAVWLGVVLVGSALVALLFFQGAPTAGRWVGAGFNLLAVGWTFFGLIRWREVGWVKRVNTFVITLLGFGLVTSLFVAVDWEAGQRTTQYLGLAVISFLVGINLLRLLLRPGLPALGVARAMIEESLHTRVFVFFICVLLLKLVMLPAILGSEDRVTYMVQRYLTYSTFILYVLLGLMTVLLSTWTVSNEVASRQIHMTLTKPLSRWQYLLGKWLGIVLFNAVLIVVSGLAIYGFTTAIAENPALNDLDRYEVDREVLTARLAMQPEPVDISRQEMIENVLAEKQRRDPAIFGEAGTPIGALPNAQQQEVVAEAVSGFYTIDGGSSKPYRFEGLGQAAAAAAVSQDKARALLRDVLELSSDEAEQVVLRMLGQPNEMTQATFDKITPDAWDQARRLLERDVIQLVFSPDMSPRPRDLFAEITLEINGYPWPPPRQPGGPSAVRELVLETPNEIAIPAALIKSDGTLIVEIAVPRTRMDGRAQPFLQLNDKDTEVALYYRVGSFESNLARGMMLLWVRLCFFAMFGLAAGSLLSFPVAALASLIFFVMASGSAVIYESLDTFFTLRDSDRVWHNITYTLSLFVTRLGEGELYDALRIVIRLIAESFMMLVPSFGNFPVAEPLANGEVIRGGNVFKAFWQIGLAWTGLVGLIGVYLFSKRELARVTV